MLTLYRRVLDVYINFDRTDDVYTHQVASTVYYKQSVESFVGT